MNESNMKSKILAGMSLILAIGIAVYSFFIKTARFAEVLPGQVLGEPTYVRNFEPFPLVFILFPVLGLAGIHLKSQRILWTATITMFLLCGLLIFSYGLLFLPSAILLLSAALFYRTEVKGASK